ncbi:helix-turn-helix domain-containing protein [Ramlibacter sp. MMS24-I3-19]|uniref:helix-turn-helix domain-containing protein n=1 Tax=Ramlibacter sp. MMS24-I3-19 TaxID=3416606 RepID=UPI003CFE5B6D
MPNIAAALKAEIARVARKEIRSAVSSLTKASTQNRKQISALRKKVAALETALKRQARGSSAQAVAEEGNAAASPRFSAKGFASNRRRLGLSAAAMAQLLGCSALSVYKWESGKTRPRPKQIEAISAIRTLGRKEAQARLEAAATPPRRRRTKAA